jgi:hypothetical protein
MSKLQIRNNDIKTPLSKNRHICCVFNICDILVAFYRIKFNSLIQSNTPKKTPRTMMVRGV